MFSVKLSALILLVSLTGCMASPDPRVTTIDISCDGVKLDQAVHSAVAFWKEAAPGQVDVNFGHCTSATANRGCIMVSYADNLGVEPGYPGLTIDGLTMGHPQKLQDIAGDIHIVISRETPDWLLAETMTHELGHAFQMRHVANPKDIMHFCLSQAMIKDREYCITKDTQADWFDTYGAQLGNVCGLITGAK